MIVFSEKEWPVDLRYLLHHLSSAILEQARTRRPSHEVSVRLLVEFGELEAAWCDYLMPDADFASPQTVALRTVGLGIGHLVRSAWLGVEHSLSSKAIESSFELLQREERLPTNTLRIRVPGGFAFYGLYPETYIQAAEEFASEHPPSKAVCIGLRSIGTALSAVVAATLEARGWQICSHTLRPRGHPFDRRPILAPDFARLLHDHCGGYALLVDEGPGISGSSLAGTAASLRELGFSEERIALFPAWKPDPSRLESTVAQSIWRRHRIYVGNFEQLWIEMGGLTGLPVRPMDQGRWRELCFKPTEYPAVQPQHERRKFLTREPSPSLIKFAGLGKYGERTYTRAQTLSKAGYTSPATSLHHGFITYRFVPGTPLSGRERGMPLFNTVARYLAFLQRACPAERSTSGEELRAMIETNTRELLGPTFGDLASRLCANDFDEAPATAVDGRMQPWEWISTPDGYLKTDATDHHADHFFPGCTDIAWDLAGFCTEFGLGSQEIQLLCWLFARHSGDTRIAARLGPFRVAYTAFRAGYAAMAEHTTEGTAEAARFCRLTEHYKRQLQVALVNLRRSSSHR